MFFEILCTWKGQLFYYRTVRPEVNNFAYWFMMSNMEISVLGSVILPAALFWC
jgi:hypothetical protein